MSDNVEMKTTGELSAIDIAAFLGDASGGASAAGYHQIQAYLQCPKKFQLAKVRGVQVPMAGTPSYFAVGSMLHAARAVWFTSKFPAWEQCKDAIKDAISKVEAEYNAKLPVPPDAARDALRYAEEYVDHYLGLPHPKVVAAEYPLGPALVGGEDRTARIDDVSYYAEGGGKLYIGECKTTSTSPSAAITEYTLHGQPMLQVLLWRAAHQGREMYGDVAGVMLDVVQKGYSGKRCTFARIPIEVTEYSLQWYSRMLGAAVKASKLVTWDSDEDRRITSCTSMIGKGRIACQYQELCRFGRDAALSYVTADGNRLTDFEPTDDKKVMPWT